MDHRPVKRRRVADPQAHAHYLHLRQARHMDTGRMTDSTQRNLEKRNPAVVSVVATIDDVVSVLVRLDDAGVATGTATVAASASPNDALAVTSISTSVPTPALSTTSTTAASTSLSSTPPIAASSSGRVVAVSSINTAPGASTPAASLITATTATGRSDSTSSTTIPSISPTSSSSSFSSSSSSVPTSTSSTSLVNLLLPTPGSNFTSFSNSTLSSALFFINSATLSVDMTTESTTTIDGSASAISVASTTLGPMVTYTSNLTPPPKAASAVPTPSTSSANSAATNNDKAGGGSSSTPIAPPQTIAGAVTGGVSGAAIIVAIIWLLLRWYRNRLNSRSAATLTGGQHFAKSRAAPSVEDAQMSMTGNHTNLLAAAAAGWLPGRRSNRSSNTPAAANGQSGFQKVQGRKMPSQFGHDSMDAPMFRDFATDWPQPPSTPGGSAGTSMGAAGAASLGLGLAAAHEQGGRNRLHRSMFSDQATYTESRLSRGDDLESGSARNSRHMSPGDFTRPERETVMPGPARTPVIEPGLYFMPPAGAYRDSQQTKGGWQSRAPSSFYADDPRGYSNPFADVPVRFDGPATRSPPRSPMAAEFHNTPDDGVSSRSSRFVEAFRRSNS